MQRYAWATAAIVVALVLAFAVVEAAGVGVLSDPRAAMSDGGAFATAVGVGLLIGDVVLPVPSSLVMLAHGALFGAGLGTLLSLLGTVGAAVAGVWIGRRSSVCSVYRLANAGEPRISSTGGVRSPSWPPGRCRCSPRPW